jgi:hypothetical protein
MQVSGNIRREIADRVLARMRERGFAAEFAAEQDSAFMNLIDDWTLGLIEMAECRSRYAGIVRERKRASNNTVELAVLLNDGDSASIHIERPKTASAVIEVKD